MAWKESFFVYRAGSVVARVTASPAGAVAAASRKTGLPMRGMYAAPLCDPRANFVAALNSFADDIRDNGWEPA